MNKKSMSDLSKFILSLNKKVGNKKTMEIVKENHVFLNGLIEGHTEKVSNEFTEFTPNQQLNFTPAKEVKAIKPAVKGKIELLNLTKIQEMLLHAISKNKNNVNIENLEKKIKGKLSGSAIGGAIGGISKKCENLGIPKIITKNETGCYSLTPEALEYLSKEDVTVTESVSSNELASIKKPRMGRPPMRKNESDSANKKREYMRNYMKKYMQNKRDTANESKAIH